MANFETFFEKAQNKFSRATDQPASDIGEAASDAQRLAEEQIDRLSAAVRANPLQSAAIAAGIGFVCAILARR